MSAPSSIKVALTGPVQLELIAPYFQAAGYEVVPADVPLDVAKPDYVYDVTAHDAVLAAEVPDFRDDRMAALSGCPYSLDGIRAIVDEFAWERLRSPRKVLAVDADNTLWRGILSEDGVDALQPFTAFQDGLIALAQSGVILVLLSKNDPFPQSLPQSCCRTLAVPPPQSPSQSCCRTLAVSPPPLLIHPYLAASKVNWEPKPGNLIEACRELNVATDSVVFVDDNPHERAQMAAHLPEVAIAPFPTDLAHPEQFLRRLKEYFFSNLGATAEDRLRTADYRANALREQYLGKSDYLDALDLRVTPSVACEADLDRLAQMAGKTNQFNATTLRRSRDEFAALLADPNHRVWVFRARDKFGEQGIVSYVVLDLVSRHITDFVMSCRAMGRTLEHFVYDFVCRELGREPIIDFVPTAKNRPFANFYASLPTPGPTHYQQTIA